MTTIRNGASPTTRNARLLDIEGDAIVTTLDWPSFWRRHRVEVHAICEGEERNFARAHDGLLKAWRRMEVAAS